MKKCLVPGCQEPLDAGAIRMHVMGCMTECRTHIEQRMKRPLPELIAAMQRYHAAADAGLLICDVCGRSGARSCPGEGQYLCDRCNTRRGINRWS